MLDVFELVGFRLSLISKLPLACAAPKKGGCRLPLCDTFPIELALAESEAGGRKWDEERKRDGWDALE